MRGFSNKNGRFIAYQTVFLFFLLFLSLFAVDLPAMPLVQAVLLGVAMLISLIGIFFGLLASLGVSLLALFLFGSLLIWGVFAGWIFPLSVLEIVIWMLIFLVAAIITGVIHRLVSQAVEEHQEMVGKFDELVTIDEVTGFSNEKRLLFDLEEELSRARRTGVPFSLMLIEVLYLDSFSKLYGRNETDYLLSSLAAILREHTRLTDRKYRLNQGNQGTGTFAVILNNSLEEGAEVVHGKLEKLMKTHILENNNKQVTLTIGFGICQYADDLSDHLELVKRAKQELDQYIQ